jgi:hypothetical protein
MIVVVVVILSLSTFGILAFVRSSKLNVQEQYMESWWGGKDASKLTEHTVPLVADQIEAGLSAAIDKMIGERNYVDSKEGYFVHISRLDRLGKQYADFKVSDQKIVKTWETELRAIADDAIVAEMQRILADMASGTEIDSLRIDDFVKYYKKFGNYEQRFEASKPALSKARAKHAGKWLRVDPSYNAGFEIIQAMLVQQFSKSSGYKLAFAPAYGPEEAVATWRSLDILCQPLQSINDNTPTDQYIFRGPPAHVIGYFIYFRMNGDPKVSTSWDKMHDSSSVRGYASVEEFVQEEIPKFTISK